MIDLYYRERDYCKLSWKMRAEEREAFSPEFVEQLLGYVERTKKELEKIISQGIKEELLPPVDSYYLACILLGLVEGMEIQWLEDPETFDLRRGMEISLQFLLASNQGMRG